MFKNLPNTTLDCPLLEALVQYYKSRWNSFCLGRCNLQFTVADIVYITGFAHEATLMELYLKVGTTTR